MIFPHTISTQTPLRAAITRAYRMDETLAVKDLLNLATFTPSELNHIRETASALVHATRTQRKKQGGVNAFLQEYDLSTDEGIALMCLAEALLRIPDKATVDRLISDKISTAKWAEHLNASDSLFVNAATWSLLLTGKVFAPTLNRQKKLSATLKRFFSKASSTVIRPIMLQGMKIMGKQFVMGTTIDKALTRAKKNEAKGYRYSYDMLGEAARTAEDAAMYFKAYENAIHAIGKASQNLDPIHGPGISIKLSALHPRYEVAKIERVHKELTPLLLKLAQLAKAENIGLTVDAEEADRLELSLDIIEAVFSDPSLKGWEGFGLAVQSYQKRAPFVIDWLADLSKRHGRKIMVRLIKGAYWDAEIKLSQMLGLEGYPVFTRKNSTDVSFIACAKQLLSYPDAFYCQFGTHNAYSLAAVLELVGTRKDFEFQCLHGMGETLYDSIVEKGIPCRIYAPVGSHKNLLGYLVRRLLENGANTSFVNCLADDTMPIEKIIADPVARIAKLASIPHPAIPSTQAIYGPNRLNSKGVDLSNMQTLTELKEAMEKVGQKSYESGPLIAGKLYKETPSLTLKSPANLNDSVGIVHEANEEQVEKALHIANKAASSWGNQPIAVRTACLEKAADLLEKHTPELLALLTREAGKQIPDAVAEIRETIDFCRYYAMRAKEDLAPVTLQGPTGEFNQLSLHSRGVIACISPWNFPLAIFGGQVVAALVTGNAVIAKPAEQTPLIAAFATRLLHEAGIPEDVLQLLPGRGEIVGAKLVADERVKGVMFTGSTDTAKHIQKALADRKGPIVPLIAETGGQNAMIVDSSALPEQVVADIISSSFNSAGQRCSALRVLFVQEDIADTVLTMLKGAMAELTIGNPSLLETDVGPVIDQDALNMLEKHAETMKAEAKLIYQLPLPSTQKGYFFPPTVFLLDHLSRLPREVFGPILHVIRFSGDKLPDVLQQIQDTGYGLTLGVHSRIDATIKHIRECMPVGNMYVNRNMIGAVVGVQPFGGEGLSGTGPKAGGPHYLPKLCVERAISINTTAAGGNASLVSLREGED